MRNAVTALLMTFVSACVPRTAIVVTHTPEPSPDIFATEMGVTSEEILEYIEDKYSEPSDQEKEAILLQFIRSRVTQPSYDPAESQLQNYLDVIEVQVEDGVIIFYVYSELPQEKALLQLFEDLFFAGLVQATDANGDFVWETRSIGVVFVEDGGRWVDMYMNQENIRKFVASPDDLYGLVDIQLSDN